MHLTFRALALPALLAACAGGGADNADRAGLASMESVCHDGYDACLATGAMPERCGSELDACLGAVADMAAACDTQLDACLGSGRDPGVCEEAWVLCTDDLWDDGGPSDGGVPPEEACRIDLDTCLQSGVDPDRCHRTFEACIEQAVVPPAPGAGEEGCRILYGSCLDLGLPPDFCAEQFDVCLDVHAANPCDSLFDTCMDLGLDPAYCGRQHAECLGLGDDGDCLDAAGRPCDDEPCIDPATGLPCDEVPPLPPGDEDCWNPDGTPCDGDCIDPSTGLPCDDGGPPPPDQACFDAFDRCLAAGIAPERCEDRLATCLAGVP